MAEPFEKQFYYLAVGEILFTDPNHPEHNTMTSKLNAVLISKGKTLAVRQLAKAQEVLQLQFRKRFQDNPELVVVDVFIINIIPLGHMTDREFNRPLEGTKAVEVTHPGVVN